MILYTFVSSLVSMAFPPKFGLAAYLCDTVFSSSSSFASSTLSASDEEIEGSFKIFILFLDDRGSEFGEVGLSFRLMGELASGTSLGRDEKG